VSVVGEGSRSTPEREKETDKRSRYAKLSISRKGSPNTVKSRYLGEEDKEVVGTSPNHGNGFRTEKKKEALKLVSVGDIQKGVPRGGVQEEKRKKGLRSEIK